MSLSWLDRLTVSVFFYVGRPGTTWGSCKYLVVTEQLNG